MPRDWMERNGGLATSERMIWSQMLIVIPKKLNQFTFLNKSIFVFPGKLEYVNIPPTPIRPNYKQSETKRKRK